MLCIECELGYVQKDATNTSCVLCKDLIENSATCTWSGLNLLLASCKTKFSPKDNICVENADSEEDSDDLDGQFTKDGFKDSSWILRRIWVPFVMTALDTTLILSLILTIIFHWKDANYATESWSLAYRINKISPKSPTKNNLWKNNFMPNET